MTEHREFRFSTVAHLDYPAGPMATDIETLRNGIATVPPESLFYHVARVALRHPRARDLPPNDFARWTAIALQDPETAERLAAAGVHPLMPLEELRASLLRILDEVRERKRPEAVARAAAFYFVSARSVSAPLALVAGEPEQVVELWSQVDAAAAFYHLVEARVLGPPGDDLVGWLRRCGAPRLAECAESLTTGGMPLLRLHRDVGARWRRSLIPARLVRRAEEPESARRQDAHAVVARIAGRLRRNPGETR